MPTDAEGEPVPPELAEQQEQKDAEVLDREGFEEHLMDRDASDVGERVDDVQEGE